MKYFATVGVSAALILASGAQAASKVQTLPAEIQGANKDKLDKAPGNLPEEQKSFLDKYQPLSEKAQKKIGKANEADFSKSGSCYAEYPCFSVERAAVVTLGDREEVTRKQVSGLIDHIVSEKKVTVSDDNDPTTPYMSYVYSKDGATFQLIAEKGDFDSEFLGGMIFDMYKLQTEDPSTNAIRAAQAKSDDDDRRPLVGLCVYPDNADRREAYNFCLGNEADGSATPINFDHQKRGLGQIKDTVCGFFSIPLLC